MKKVHIIAFDDFGEYEVAALDDGTMLDIWSNNDASWRNEYFGPFMKKLDIRVNDDPCKTPKGLIPKMQAFRKKVWGDDG